MTSFVPLTKEAHANTKVKIAADFDHVRDQHILPVLAQEFGPVSGELPIVFVKNTDNEKIAAVAMTSLTPGSNLLLEGDKWATRYVPACVRNVPFVLMPAPQGDEGQFIVGIDEDHTLVGTEGEALFKEDGTETEFLDSRKKSLGQYYDFDQMTQAIGGFLQEKELLEARTLTVEVKGEKRNIDGILVVNETKLNELSDEDFLDMRKRGLLPMVYAHLGSLQHIQMLAKLTADQSIEADKKEEAKAEAEPA